MTIADGNGFEPEVAARLEGVAKTFGKTLALAPLDLEIRRGEFLTVLGPSGCGKSTLMRLLAGLEFPDIGSLWQGGKDVTRLSADHRDVALVFQLFTLYPHLTVLDNVTFPLRARGMAASEAEGLALHWLRFFEVDHFSRLKPKGLSQGDRQKIAMARALVRQAGLFLFDEPFSALDPGTRESLWERVRMELAARGATAILVTHDQTEAMALGDRLAVMRRGQLQQCDTPAKVYERPANVFVADFVGRPGMNLLSARKFGEWVQVDELAMRMRVSEGVAGLLKQGREMDHCLVGIRPEWVVIADGGVPLPVEHVAALGPANLLELRLGNGLVRSWLPSGVKKNRGESVPIQWMASACRFFDGETGELLSWKALEVECLPGN